MTSGVAKGSGAITVGAADFSEAKTVSYLYRIVLKAPDTR